MMHMQTAPLPVHFQMLCESSKLYDPGQQYASHVRQLQRDDEPDVDYDFEPHVSASTWYGHLHVPGGAGFPPDVGPAVIPRHGARPPSCSPLAVGPTRSPVMRDRKGSFNVPDVGAEAAGSAPEEGGPSDGALAKERRGECPAGASAEWGSAVSPQPSLETPFLQVGVATRCTSPGPSPSPTLRVA